MPSEYQKDGDIAFVGLNSRDNPSSLSAGIVSRSQNFRLDRGVATTRKGLQRKTIGSLVGQSVYGTGTYIDTSGQEIIILVVANGLYYYNPQTETLSAKVYFPNFITGKTLSSADGITVTINSNAHGLIVGDSVFVEATQDGYTGLYTVTAKTTNSFTYVMAAVASYGAVGLVSCSYSHTELITTTEGCEVCNALDKVFISRGFSKRPLVWDLNTTITALPTSGAGHPFPNCTSMLFYANRMIVLGKHHAEPVALRNYDTVSVSNFLDYENWDALDAFTINNGSNDQVVCIAPWTLNEFLVFMRNSIFYINVGGDRYISGDALSATSYIKTLATDIGCLAKKSVVQAGGGVFFLSDSGVYFLQPQPASAESMKLLTMADPISSPIDDIIQRINRNYAKNAVATYWNNRYYLAVPLDDSTVNNTVLVYNFILRQWESVDRYPAFVSTTNSLTATEWVFYQAQSAASSSYYYISVRKNDTPRHGMAVGNYINVSFGSSYSGATPKTERPPNGSYLVVNAYESGALPFNETDFAIRIPKSDFAVQPFNGIDTWTYATGACSFTKAESISLKEFIVAKKNNQRRMFLIDNNQGVFLTEELNYDEFGKSIGSPVLPNPIAGVDSVSDIAIGRYGDLKLVAPFDSFGNPSANVIILETLSFTKNNILAILETRQYTFAGMADTQKRYPSGLSDKRFSSYEANFVTTGGETIETYVDVYNPDVTVKVDSFGASSNEDYIRSNQVRKTGSGATIRFVSYSKRPSIRSAYIYAKQQFKNNINKQ